MKKTIVLLAMILLSASALLAEKIQLEIEGSPGLITVLSYSFSVARELEPTRAGTTALFAGVSTFGPLVVTKAFDAQTPLNLLSLLAGDKAKTVKLHVFHDKGSESHFILTGSRLGACRIVPVKGRHQEVLEFLFQKISFEKTGDTAAGKQKVVCSWDVITNKSF